MTVSYILAMLLLIFGFYFTLSLMKIKADSEIATDFCGDLEISKDEAFSKYKIFQSFETDFNTCYCLQQYRELGSNVKDQISFPDGTFPCK